MSKLNIDNLLKKYNFTQKDLSECTGINKNTVSKYCNNTFESINKDHIDLLCKFFNCTPNDLFEIDSAVRVNIPSTKMVSGIVGATAGLALAGVAGGIAGSLIGITKEEHSTGLKWFNPFTWSGTNNDETTITHEIDVAKEQSIEMRLSFEMSINWEVSELINKLIEHFTSNYVIDDKIDKIFKNYLDEDDILAVNTRLEKYCLPLLILLNQHPLEGEILSFLTYIRNIYARGGLSYLSDDELNNLMKYVRYYNDHNFIEKEN